MEKQFEIVESDQAKGQVPIRVLGAHILLRPEDPEEKLQGGLVLPEHVKADQQAMAPRGIVVAVGPGQLLPSGERVPLGVEVGDEVLVDYRMTKAFPEGGQTWVLCTEDAIMGVVVG